MSTNYWTINMLESRYEYIIKTFKEMEESDMLVIGSSETPKRKRVYHKWSCMYAQRIKPNNRIKMIVSEAEKRHFCECKFCGGFKGEIRIHKNNISLWKRKYKMEFTYQENCDTLYIRTKIGFWKIVLKEDRKYLLYHRNTYRSEMSFTEASHGVFHRQKDVKAMESIVKIIEYIGAHDKAKPIIMKDYRELPKHSKKQKKYYKQAQKKARRSAVRRVYSIFELIEKENQEFKTARY